MKIEKFKVLLYLKKSGMDKNGKAPIMGRITVNRTMAQFSCKLSCTPSLWNPRASRLEGKSKEAVETNKDIEQLLLSIQKAFDVLVEKRTDFEAKDVKEALQGSVKTQTTLLSFVDEHISELSTHEGIDMSKSSVWTYRKIRKNLAEFIGEKYKLFLKRDQGRIDSYVNHCLLWLNMLMYKAVDRSIIRFNPIAKIGYEKKAAPKMTHISKADFIRMLSTPMADERTELARRCFIFASLTSLSYIDVKKLYPHHISENSEGRNTFGVLMLNEDIPIGSIAKMMGHADITSTQVYAQVTEQKISNDMDKLIAKRERNIKVILKEGILREYDVCRHVKEDDHINYDVYNLELIIAVAFWIDSIENRAFREFIMQAIIKKQTNRPKFVCLWSKNIMV